MKKIHPKVILWDWDNTLIDSRPAAFRALKAVAEENGRPEPTLRDIIDVMGTHQGRYWHEHYAQNMLPIIKRYLDLYQDFASDLEPFPETKSLLTWIQQQGIPQLVVSNKNQSIIDSEAERFGLTPYFDRIVGTDWDNIAKPTKAFADKALGSIWPESILMIGDGESDMQFAEMIHAFGLFIRPGRDTVPFSYNKRVQNLSDVFKFLKQELT